MKTTIRVAVADHEVAFRAGIRVALAADRFEIVVEVATLAELLAALAETPVDVVLIDEEMCPSTDSLPFPAAGILARQPTVRGLHRAIASGALGYIGRDLPAARLPLVVEDIASGISVLPTDITAVLVDELVVPYRSGALTQRQTQVRRLVEAGMPTAEIAGTLGISPVTVRRHLSDLKGRLAKPADAAEVSPRPGHLLRRRTAA